MSGADIHPQIEAVWKSEAARVTAALMRMVRNLDLAEDFAQEALLAALEKWPNSGIPPNPGAWLMTTAKRRAIDYFRFAERSDQKHQQLGRELLDLERTPPDLVKAMDDPIGDDVLKLIFV